VPDAVPGSGARRFQATRDQDGTFAMVYSASARKYLIDTRSLTGDQLRFWWFNPRDGSHTDSGLFQKQPQMEICPPYIGEDIDSVLVIDDAKMNFPPPGDDSSWFPVHSS
jgi:hypothetical protein